MKKRQLKKKLKEKETELKNLQAKIDLLYARTIKHLVI